MHRTMAQQRHQQQSLESTHLYQPANLEETNNNNILEDDDNHDAHEDENEDHRTESFPATPDRAAAAQRTLWNFIWMSIFFSANHGCVVACLSLATTRFGSTGAWTSGVLYLTYTASSVLGATYVVKQMGPRNALVVGMSLYCVYVGCFWLATLSPDLKTPAALIGATIGGIGAGFLWTAQGSYFGRAAEEYASLRPTGHTEGLSDANASLASIFAFLYLAEEVSLRALSTFLLEFGWAWSVVFATYTVVAVISAILMLFVYDYPTVSTTTSNAATTTESSSLTPEANDGNISQSSVWYKVSAAWQLLRKDPKMKYMIGLNAVFGFTSAFLNSYVNGEVVRVATHDDKSKSVGIFNAWVSCVAAVMSLLFARLSHKFGGNGPVLIFGAICFFGVVFPFVVLPDTTQWGIPLLLMVYTFHGTGRATFEGTLKATFADYFAYEKEGAFANIILQNGLSGAIGYVLTFTLVCSNESRYCIKYNDGSLHDVLTFELLVIFSAIMAVVGYWRASALYRAEEVGSGDRVLDSEVEDAMVPLSITEE